MKRNKKRLEAKKVEKAIYSLIIFLGIFGITIFILWINNSYFNKNALIVEMFIVILIAILAQTAILTKLIEKLI